MLQGRGARGCNPWRPCPATFPPAAPSLSAGFALESVGVLAAVGHLSREGGLRSRARLGVLAQHGQVSQRPQPEELEEGRRRGQGVGRPGSSLRPIDSDEVAVEEHLERRARVDTSHVVDLGARDGLPVRDDRGTVSTCGADPSRASPGESLTKGAVGRARSELPRARDLVEVDAAGRVSARSSLRRRRTSLASALATAAIWPR